MNACLKGSFLVPESCYDSDLDLMKTPPETIRARCHVSLFTHPPTSSWSHKRYQIHWFVPLDFILDIFLFIFVSFFPFFFFLTTYVHRCPLEFSMASHSLEIWKVSFVSDIFPLTSYLLSLGPKRSILGFDATEIKIWLSPWIKGRDYPTF